MLHGELNTSKTKTVLGHGCESVGVSHVAGIVLGMGGQRAQSQRTVLMPELGCRVRTELSTMPGLLRLPFLFYFPAKLSSYSHSTLPGTNGICSHTCSNLCGNTVLSPEVFWRCTLVKPLSPGLISCASFDVPQLWNAPEMVGEPLMLCQKRASFSLLLLLKE